MPGRSASGASASTSDHASSELTKSVLASRPAGVGYTRRLDRSAQCTHSVWSMYGGGGAGATSARAVAAIGWISGRTAAATATNRSRRIELARLPLDIEEFRPDVDQVDASRTGGDDRAHDPQHKREKTRHSEDDQPHRLGQLACRGVRVAALHRRVNERVDRQREAGELQNDQDGVPQLEHHCSSLRGHRPDRRTALWFSPELRSTPGSLLGDLLGRTLLGRGLLGAGLLHRGGLLDGLLRGSLLGGLLRRVAADQLRGPLTHRAGLAGDVAERLLGQLDGLAEPLLGLRAALLEARLAAQPLQRGLATRDQLVVQLGGLLAVTLGGLTQLVAAQAVTELLGALRQILAQLGDPAAGLLDPARRVGAGLLGALTQRENDVVDTLEGQVSGADRSEQRSLQVLDVGVVLLGLLSHGVCPFVRLTRLFG